MDSYDDLLPHTRRYSRRDSDEALKTIDVELKSGILVSGLRHRPVGRGWSVRQ